MNDWVDVGQVGKQRQPPQQHEQPGPTADADGQPEHGPAATVEQQHAGGVEGKEQL